MIAFTLAAILIYQMKLSSHSVVSTGAVGLGRRNDLNLVARWYLDWHEFSGLFWLLDWRKCSHVVRLIHLQHSPESDANPQYQCSSLTCWVWSAKVSLLLLGLCFVQSLRGLSTVDVHSYQSWSHIILRSLGDSRRTGGVTNGENRGSAVLRWFSMDVI